jgi:hypothetical protein
LSTTSASKRVIERPDRPAVELSLSKPAHLPKRDFFLLPLLSLLTVLVLFGMSEAVTRVLWPAEYSRACIVADPVEGFRFKPNCSVRGKIAEGPSITYHYNECGYRSEDSCGPKPPGTIRIAILGSSMSQALHVSYDDAFFLVQPSASAVCVIAALTYKIWVCRAPALPMPIVMFGKPWG